MPSTAGHGQRGDTDLLARAANIQLTDADRQEGYDEDLLNAQPRGQGRASPRQPSPLPSHGQNDHYVSRPVAAYSNEKPTGLPRPASSRSSSRAGAKPWYKKWWIWAIVAVVVIGAAVGGGVGGSQASKKSSNASSAGVGEAGATTTSKEAASGDAAVGGATSAGEVKTTGTDAGIAAGGATSTAAAAGGVPTNAIGSGAPATFTFSGSTPPVQTVVTIDSTFFAGGTATAVPGFSGTGVPAVASSATAAGGVSLG